MTVGQQKKPRKRHWLPSADDEETETSRFGPGMSLRKKGMGVRAWLVLESAGQVKVLEARKHPIMRRTGLRGRDLRILDPLLSYPSTVLGREKAMVVNLEHIKATLTAQEVLLLNYKDPAVAPFAQDLQWRLFRLHQAAKNKWCCWRVGEAQKVLLGQLYVTLKSPRAQMEVRKRILASLHLTRQMMSRVARTKAKTQRIEMELKSFHLSLLH